MNHIEKRSGPAQRIGRAVMIGVVIAISFAAGMFWRGSITKRPGLGDKSGWMATSEADTQRQLWTCGMHPQVIQDKLGLCPICNMQLTPVQPSGTARTSGGAKKVKYWWDPMIGPSSISDKPGKSAMGMDLVPVYADETAGDPAVTIDPVVVQNMGVRVRAVAIGNLTKEIRAVGYLKEAQPNIHDVNLRVSGWIEKLHASTEGMYIQAGEPLFDLYSPEMLVAIEEFALAERQVSSRPQAADSIAREGSERLRYASRRKLELWGLTPEQVDRLGAESRASGVVTFLSPDSGFLTEKAVVKGAAVKSGDRVLRLVDLSTLWLDAQVFEQHLPYVSLSQKVTATLESMPGASFEGEVIFIHPQIDPMTRTATVRMGLPNPDLQLRPGMYATAVVVAEVASDVVLVPREAVIDTGTRQVAFVSLGEGRFEPRLLKLGLSGNEGMVQVVEGLTAGDSVVTSGQFMLDAESRFREALQKQMEKDLVGREDSATLAPQREHDAHSGASAPASTAPSVALPWSPNVDEVYRGYLRIAEALGAPQQSDNPIDVRPLVVAADKVAQTTQGAGASHPADVLSAANAMEQKPLVEQREALQKLSRAVITMAEGCPPSTQTARRLFVLYCPMVQARWLQRNEKVANPYYANEMKDCGSVERELATVER